MAINRKAVNSLLTKLGVEAADKLGTERAQEKLVKKIQAKGIPAELSADESTLLTELGLDKASESAPAAEAGDDKPAKKVKAPKPPKEKKVREVNENAARQVFIHAFDKGPVSRYALMNLITEKAGCDAGTIRNYIWKAKFSSEAFGFQLTEERTGDGVKMLSKVK